MSFRPWVISDGHAGNLRQADALAAALSSSPARDLRVRPGWLARALAPRRFPGAPRQLGDRFADALQEPPPLLAIGCGRQAALATRLLRLRGSKAVQILDPRIALHHWDLVIAPEHDVLQGANTIAVLGSLNPIDDAWLAHARRRFQALATLPRPRTALLLGGRSRHAQPDPTTPAALLDAIDTLLTNEGGSLMLTGSRRTEPDTRRLLRQRYAGGRHLTWLDEDDGPNPYPGLLAWADRIICSPDSVNMISEACATTAPVFIHTPSRMRGGPRRFLDALLARGRVRPLTARPEPFSVIPLRETARVAAEVAQRLSLPPPSASCNR